MLKNEHIDINLQLCCNLSGCLENFSTNQNPELKSTTLQTVFVDMVTFGHHGDGKSLYE